MADIVSYPINSARSGVSVTSYQQADSQRRDLDRAAQGNTQFSDKLAGEQSLHAGKLGGGLEAARVAARTQKVEKTAAQEETSKKSDKDPQSGAEKAGRGRSVDVRA